MVHFYSRIQQICLTITFLSLLGINEINAQDGCPNTDFSAGDFSNWDASSGSYHHPDSLNGFIAGRHTIINSQATDPYTCGGLQVIPSGAKVSARLGNDQTRGEAEQLKYRLIVDATNDLFVYKYALVLENPADHAPNERPEFNVRVVDSLGQTIGNECGAYTVYGGQESQNFKKCGSISWLPWSTVAIDLSKYHGQEVTIEFTTKDCLLSKHFGYAYISAFCAPMQLTLNYCPLATEVTLKAPHGFSSYNWSNGVSTSEMTLPTPALGTIFSCSLTTFSNQGNCTVSLSISIEPNQIKADFEMDNTCTITPAHFTNKTVLNTGKVSSYLWDFGFGFTSTEAEPTHVFLIHGNRDIKLFVRSEAGCVDSTVQQHLIKPTPIPIIQQAGNCITNPIVFSATGIFIQPVTFVWKLNDSIVSNGNSNWEHAFPLNKQDTITLVATNDYGCSYSFSKKLNLAPALTIDAGKDISGCIGSTFTPTASGGINYTWSNGLEQGINSTIQSTQNMIVTGYNNLGCSDTDTLLVTALPQPEIYLNSPLQKCLGDSVKLEATGNNPIIWEAGFENASIQIPSLGKSIFNLESTNQYGCVAFDSLVVYVHELPQLDVADSLFGCAEKSIQLNASGCSTIVWNSDIQNGSEITFQDNTTLSVKGTNEFGCTIQKSVPFILEDAPQIAFLLTEQKGCAPFEAIFTPLSTTNYNWQLQNGEIVHASKSIHKTYSEIGCFDEIVTVYSLHGCKSDTILTNVVCTYASPIAQFRTNTSSTTELYTQIEFQNESANASKFNWNFGDGTTSNSINNTHVFPSESGTYYVKLIAENEFGCQAEHAEIIEIVSQLRYFVPSTFTPNGDRINAVFHPVFASGLTVNTFHLSIFNRWGEEIFHSQDPNDGWDGTFNGDTVQEGTYLWKMEFVSSEDSGHKVVTGNVNVLL